MGRIFNGKITTIYRAEFKRPVLNAEILNARIVAKYNEHEAFSNMRSISNKKLFTFKKNKLVHFIMP
jgi:hypothetical protein